MDAIVVNSAGCGSAMKEYGELLAGDPAWAARAAALAGRVRDFAEFLADLASPPAAARHPLPVSAVYHDACHLGHAQGIKAQPRALLRAIPGLELSETGDGGTCCGSAGVYNLLQPEAASELGQRKAATVAATGAQLLISRQPRLLAADRHGAGRAGGVDAGGAHRAGAGRLDPRAAGEQADQVGHRHRRRPSQ